MKIRTSIFAPLALGLVFAVGTARAAAAQETAPAQGQTPPQQTQPQTGQPPAGQPQTGQPQTGQQQQQQQAAATEPTFSGNVGILLVQIKPDQTAAYEGLLNKLKEALHKSEKPEMQQMAKGWRVFRSADGMNGNTLYVHIVDPVTTGQNYLETYKLISEVFPSEVQDLYAKTKDAFVPGGLGRLNLTLVTDLSQP